MRRGAAFVAAVVLVGALAGCVAGADQPSAPASPPANAGALGAGGSGVDVLADARALAATGYRGTYQSPDPAPRPAVPAKKVAVISGGQQAPSFAIPVAGAAEAARALGWDVQVYDLKLNRANAGSLIKEAVAAGVNGIVANFDCVFAPAELAEARARGIEIVSLYGFDCNDPSFGPASGPAQFSTAVNYGVTQSDLGKYTAGFGALIASTIIAASEGKAKVINVTDPTATVLRYVQLGFAQQMARCGGCTVLETVESTPAELGKTLEDKITAAMARHPDATVIRAANSAGVQLSVAPAVVKAGRQHSISVVGGEGFIQDLDLIRTRKGLNVTLLIDSTWTGWAAVDALNSRFVGEPARAAGFGVMVIDREHNLTPSGPAQHNIDFKRVYRRAWGVG
jgi:ribose transport system substrate-binding protein